MTMPPFCFHVVMVTINYVIVRTQYMNGVTTGVQLHWSGKYTVSILYQLNLSLN